MSQKLIDWRTAKEQGLKTYFPGTACKRGGIAERLISGRCLCEACREARNERDRQAHARMRAEQGAQE